MNNKETMNNNKETMNNKETSQINNKETSQINNKEISQINNKETYLSQIDIDDIFINLRLISKIEIGDKIIDNDKYLNIDYSYIKSLTRWYYDINRKNNFKFINNIFQKAFILNDEIINNNNSLLIRLNNELKFSINGLLNYKQTYITDKLFQSEIDVLIENIRNKIDQNNLKDLNK
jgi:hypothetical protein